MGLDTVELVLAVEETFDIVIPDAECEKMVTPRMLIDWVSAKVGAGDVPSESLAEKVFVELRNNLAEITGTPPNQISKDTPIKSIFQKPDRKEKWNRFVTTSGSVGEALPKKFPGFFSGTYRVGDFIPKIVFAQIGERDRPIAWTKSEVREVIRLIIVEQLGVDDDFSDDDRFVEDLGVD